MYESTIPRRFWVSDCSGNPFECFYSKDWSEKRGGDSQTPKVSKLDISITSVKTNNKYNSFKNNISITYNIMIY